MKRNYAFTDFIADLGGLQTVLLLLGSFVFCFLSDKFFMQKILKNLFLVNKPNFPELGSKILKKGKPKKVSSSARSNYDN